MPTETPPLCTWMKAHVWHSTSSQRKTFTCSLFRRGGGFFPGRVLPWGLCAWFPWSECIPHLPVFSEASRVFVPHPPRHRDLRMQIHTCTRTHTYHISDYKCIQPLKHVCVPTQFKWVEIPIDQSSLFKQIMFEQVSEWACGTKWVSDWLSELRYLCLCVTFWAKYRIWYDFTHKHTNTHPHTHRGLCGSQLLGYLMFPDRRIIPLSQGWAPGGSDPPVPQLTCWDSPGYGVWRVLMNPSGLCWVLKWQGKTWGMKLYSHPGTSDVTASYLCPEDLTPPPNTLRVRGGLTA